MKIHSFTIKKYRAIENVYVPISSTLIPIIGVNESGKTSVLQAILAFDKLKDNYNKGEHLNYKNKFNLGNQPAAEILAKIEIDSQHELNEIIAALDFNDSDAIIENLKDYFSEKKNFFIGRNLETKKYFVEGFPVDKSKSLRFAKAIYNAMPYILYFDDFSDRVPENIIFQQNYTDDQEHGKGEKAEWKYLIEEIFKRATNGDCSLGDFFKIKDEDEKQGRLSDVKDTLNSEIIADWKKLKQKGRAFAEDEEDLELKVEFSALPTGEFGFSFKVIDKSKEGKSRQFDVTTRSKGFQWFFNFTMKLKFNAKYQDKPEGAIYLLDEPGSYLHSSAQEELLKELKDISKLNTILYCTHSQHLLDPDFVNVRNIKIAEKESGNIQLKGFGESGTKNNLGALTPLYDALQIKAHVLSKGMDNVILTEGITDYYFFKMLFTFSIYKTPNNVEIIPGAGASQLKDLISLAITFSNKYMVLLDSDLAGNKAYDDYLSFFGSEESKNIFKYKIINKSDNKVLLEDFLSESDKLKLTDITGATDDKSAVIELFFLDKNIQESFFESLDEDSISNLKIVANKIKSHFK